MEPVGENEYTSGKTNFQIGEFLCLDLFVLKFQFYVKKNFLLMLWLGFRVCWLRFKSTTAAATSVKLSARCSSAYGQFVCLLGLLKWLLNEFLRLSGMFDLVLKGRNGRFDVEFGHLGLKDI